MSYILLSENITKLVGFRRRLHRLVPQVIKGFRQKAGGVLCCTSIPYSQAAAGEEPIAACSKRVLLKVFTSEPSLWTRALPTGACVLQAIWKNPVSPIEGAHPQPQCLPMRDTCSM